MVFVSEGEFLMGRDDGASEEKPLHKVLLPSFWIDRNDVTNAQFARFVDEMKYSVKGEWKETGPEQANRPATHVTLDDAKSYARWAGKRLTHRGGVGEGGQRHRWTALPLRQRVYQELPEFTPVGHQ